MSEYVQVPDQAVEWLKKHYPALCIKAGLCERIAGRLYTRTTTTPAQQDAPMDADTRAILQWIMRTAESAKEPCGPDPESPAAIRNGKLASIAQAAAQALGMLRGPSFAPAQDAERERDAAHIANLIEVTRMSNAEYVAAAHNEAVRYVRARAQRAAAQGERNDWRRTGLG